MTMHGVTRTSLLACTAMTVAGLMASPALAAAEEESGLHDIVVTAQKREQNVQDVPIAVTAISGDTLQVNRVTDVTDLTSLAPGVTVRTSAGGSQLPSFTIRGAVSYGVVPGSDKEVSIYLDGVYISSPRGSIFDLPDVQRIEVLRGPQGTLFGRNATAGAVSITTRDPSGEIGVKASGTVGNHNQTRFQLSVDLPQVGPFSGYVSFVNLHKRGDIHNLGAGMLWDRSSSKTSFIPAFARSPEWLGSKDTNSYFAALKFESGDFKTVYKFDRYEFHGTPEGTGFVGYDPNFPVAGPLISLLLASQGFTVPTAFDGKRPKEVWNSYVVPSKAYVEGHSLTSTYQVSDAITVKNIAAYRVSQIWASSSLGGLSALSFPPYGTPFTVVSTQSQSRSRQWSDEIQFNYQSDFLTATVGGVWFHSKDWSGENKQPGTSFFGSFPGGVIGNDTYAATFNKATSIAAYAQLEFHLTHQLTAILGGRVTHDSKAGYVAPGATLATETLLPFTYKDTRPNYLVGVNFKPTEDILVYAKYSTAYVSGGSVGGVPFDPETTRSVEGGVKAEMLDRKLRTNIAIYWARYKNFQTAQAASFVTSYVTAVTGDPTLAAKLGTIVVPQGGPVTSRGFEFDFTAAPVQGVTVGGSLGYDKTTFKDVDPLLLAANAGVYNNVPGLNVPIYRPHWTGGLWGQYDTPPVIGDAYVMFRLDGNFQSNMPIAPNPLRAAYAPAIIAQKRYWMVNGRVALRDLAFGNLKTELGVWGKNLTNARAMTFGLEIAGIISGANYVPARSYGLDLTIEF